MSLITLISTHTTMLARPRQSCNNFAWLYLITCVKCPVLYVFRENMCTIESVTNIVYQYKSLVGIGNFGEYEY